MKKSDRNEDLCDAYRERRNKPSPSGGGCIMVFVKLAVVIGITIALLK